MKRKLILVIIGLLCVTFLCTPTVSASQIPERIEGEAPGITPCWNNVDDVRFNFRIYSGTGELKVNYGGYSTFAYAKLTVKVQKRTLGIFWRTVDIGEPDNEWITASANSSDQFLKIFTVEDTGTYRAKFLLEVTGTNGETEEIEETIVVEYG